MFKPLSCPWSSRISNLLVGILWNFTLILQFSPQYHLQRSFHSETAHLYTYLNISLACGSKNQPLYGPFEPTKNERSLNIAWPENFRLWVHLLILLRQCFSLRVTRIFICKRKTSSKTWWQDIFQLIKMKIMISYL